jgi:hypothetical protein
MKYQTKTHWETQIVWWAMREDKKGKIRFDLLPLEQLERLAELYTRWADKYEANNCKNWWPEAIESYRQSAWRHFIQFMKWDTDEDHTSAVIFNLWAVDYLSNNKK